MRNLCSILDLCSILNTSLCKFFLFVFCVLISPLQVKMKCQVRWGSVAATGTYNRELAWVTSYSNDSGFILKCTEKDSSDPRSSYPIKVHLLLGWGVVAMLLPVTVTPTCMVFLLSLLQLISASLEIKMFSNSDLKYQRTAGIRSNFLKSSQIPFSSLDPSLWIIRSYHRAELVTNRIHP